MSSDDIVSKLNRVASGRFMVIYWISPAENRSSLSLKKTFLWLRRRLWKKGKNHDDLKVYREYYCGIFLGRYGVQGLQVPEPVKKELKEQW